MKLAFDNEAIKTRIVALARCIDADYLSVGKLHMIGILPDGYQLVSDVSKALKTHHTVDFVLEQREPVFPLTSRKYIRNGLHRQTNKKDVLVVTTLLRDERVIYDTYTSILCEENPRTIRLLALLYYVSEIGLNPKPNYIGFPIKGHPKFQGYGLPPQPYLRDIYEHVLNGKRKSNPNHRL